MMSRRIILVIASGLGWVLAASSTMLIVYPVQLSVFLTGAREIISGEFVSGQNTYPLAAGFITAFFITLNRGRIASRIQEDLTNSSAYIFQRSLGFLLVLTPLAAAVFVDSEGLLFSSMALVLSCYGVANVLFPRASRMVLPYVLAYLFMAPLPYLIFYLAGAYLPFYVVSLTKPFIDAMSIPGAWLGNSLEMGLAGGGEVRVLITRECADVVPVSLFLLLSVLAYLDLGPSRASIVKLVSAVSLVFVLLVNPLRIAIILLFTHLGGEAALLELHGWIGYALSLMVFAVSLGLYGKRFLKPTSLLKQNQLSQL